MILPSTNARIRPCPRTGNLAPLALSKMLGEEHPLPATSSHSASAGEDVDDAKSKSSTSSSEPSESRSEGEHVFNASSKEKALWASGGALAPKGVPHEPVDAGNAGPDQSVPEIQEMLDQFAASSSFSPESTPNRSPVRVTFASTPISLPERKSSLDPFRRATTQRTLDGNSIPQARRDTAVAPGTMQSEDVLQGAGLSSVAAQSSGKAASNHGAPRHSIPSASPPEQLSFPEPAPDVPFDFHRFLEQLRHRTADPVAKFLRSFLTEFGKKPWMAHEQVKIVSDFLCFIAGKMAQCEVWRDLSDAEFENAKEGMEKLVMNRLYSQTFSPAIPSAGMSASQKGDKHAERRSGPGRRGQHQEDVERDEILAQKIQIYRWIREPHLDIPAMDDQGSRFLGLAQQGAWYGQDGWARTDTWKELLKLQTYRAPRDKVICVLNCCKVIFGETGLIPMSFTSERYRHVKELEAF